MRFPVTKFRRRPKPRLPVRPRVVLRVENDAIQALDTAFNELSLVLDRDEIREAIEAGDLATLLDLFDVLEWELHEYRLRTEMSPRVQRVMQASGQQAFEETRNLASFSGGTSPPALPPTTFSDPPPSPGPRAKLYSTLRFDMSNPMAIMHAERFAADLVREVTRATRAAIRDAVVTAFREGVTADRLARQLRTTIGLTTRQARSVENYRARLENAGILDDDVIDVMTRRYYRQVRARRAETIARTEILRSSNEGRRQGWLSAADVGWLDVNQSVKEWVSTPDGPSVIDSSKPETCPICSAMDGVKVQGLEGEFALPSGRKVQMPPAHPNCRCTAVVHPPEPPEDWDPEYPHARA